MACARSMDMNAGALRHLRGVTIASLVALSLVLVACGEKKEKSASQTAARVNKEEITVHQINFLLQQQRGLPPEQTDEASREILERLIDQELAVQKAEEFKLDREPRVVQQLEAAKREILARAYADKVVESMAQPTPEDIEAYYKANPALFSERRIYSLQELRIEVGADQIDALRAKYQSSKDINEFVAYLRSAGLRFNVEQVVRGAEQLPLSSLELFARMKDGETMFNPVPNGAAVIVLTGSRNQPVAEEAARPAIAQFLLTRRKREFLEKERQSLRASAAVQYIGKFAEGAPPAAAAASTPAEGSALPGLAVPAGEAAPAAPAAPAVAASGGLDPAAISKGLGLK